jgi:hypothetical protein
MGTIFNDDFRDFIHAMNHHDVEYILVGGYAVILHGYRRVTGDYLRPFLFGITCLHAAPLLLIFKMSGQDEIIKAYGMMAGKRAFGNYFKAS